jgi:hypothetical protein
MLLLESPPAEPLDHVIDGPMDLGGFLRIVVAVSAAVSAIIMKLLAKTPEERYQTAAGAKRNLRRCQRVWLRHRHRHRSIKTFELGRADVPERLLVNEFRKRLIPPRCRRNCGEPIYQVERGEVGQRIACDGRLTSVGYAGCAVRGSRLAPSAREPNGYQVSQGDVHAR